MVPSMLPLTKIILSALVLTTGLANARAASITENSMLEGIEAIKGGKINDSMNCLRKSVNCSAIEGRAYGKHIRESLNKLKDEESNKERKAAICVYLGVVEIVAGNKDQSIALGFLNEASEYNPELPETYNTRGIVYAMGGFNDKAIADYSRAIELNPRYVDALNNRSRAYLRAGNRESAVKDYAAYQDLLNSLYYQQ